MSAFATLSLLNEAAVAQSFAPAGIDTNGVAKWLTQTESVFDGRRSATMSVTLPRANTSVARIKQKIVIPIMDTVDTTKKVAEAYALVEFVIPKQANSTTRLDLRKYADQLVMNAVTTAAVTNFESIY